MASSQKTAKQNSRWGFLSQAVASVEGRLDAILADEEDLPKKAPSPNLVSKENNDSSRNSTDSTRSATAPPQNDRLQERLARAMAKKNSGKSEGSTLNPESISRSSTPSVPHSRNSLQGIERLVEMSEQPGSQDRVSDSAASHDFQNLGSTPPVSSDLAVSDIASDVQHSEQVSTTQSTDDVDATVLKVQLEHEEAMTRVQEEVQTYIERIDALGAKLQYLAREAAHSAQQAGTEAEAGSMEKRMAEKDEKIALLMQEGQKLSVTEMKNLSAIKKLRAQLATSNKDQDAVRQRAVKAEKQASALAERIQKTEQAVKKAEDKVSRLDKMTQDLDAVTRERNALNVTLSEMKIQIAKANARAENAESKAATDKLEAERKANAELKDDLVSAKVERELAEEKFRREIRDLQSAFDREKESSRAMETEMLAEQATLETRLESFRVRAEEASSNDHGDTQAKMLRQIETLQSQYATASQNWQGIEGNLLARNAALEKERDDVAARESEVRKKVREATARAKNSERAAEETQLKVAGLEDSHADAQAEIQQLTKRYQQLEEELAHSRKESDGQRKKLEREFTRRIEEERGKWATSLPRPRNESPSASTRKSMGYDMERLMSPTLTDRPTSRRSSAWPSRGSAANAYSPSRQDSNSSMRKASNGIVAETPPMVATFNESDEYFAGVPITPGSEEQIASRPGVNDMISASTVGVGPSVQLVERMSANVRRLESEKAASKEEILRLTSQRDESRGEVVRLMRDVDSKKRVEARLKSLEAEHAALTKRQQTTLEMLGEKSEKVEELTQDVADLKQIQLEFFGRMK